MLESLADLLLPPACLLCRQRLPSAEPPVCPACEVAMRACHDPVCARCGMPMRGAYDRIDLCSSCRRRPPAFDHAQAPLLYIGAGRQTVTAFKYQGHRRLGRWLASRMAGLAARRWPRPDLVVPVPMPWLRARLRRLNAAALLAEEIGRRLGCPVHPHGLHRIRWTRSQTRVGASRRFENVRGAFRASRPLTGQTVLLVDDVLTSGATAQACAQALRQAGAARVLVLTAARTPAAS